MGRDFSSRKYGSSKNVNCSLSKQIGHCALSSLCFALSSIAANALFLLWLMFLSGCVPNPNAVADAAFYSRPSLAGHLSALSSRRAFWINALDERDGSVVGKWQLYWASSTSGEQKLIGGEASVMCFLICPSSRSRPAHSSCKDSGPR